MNKLLKFQIMLKSIQYCKLILYYLRSSSNVN